MVHKSFLSLSWSQTLQQSRAAWVIQMSEPLHWSAGRELHTVVRSDFCDWHLETPSPNLSHQSRECGDMKQRSQQTGLYCWMMSWCVQMATYPWTNLPLLGGPWGQGSQTSDLLSVYRYLWTQNTNHRVQTKHILPKEAPGCGALGLWWYKNKLIL